MFPLSKLLARRTRAKDGPVPSVRPEGTSETVAQLHHQAGIEAFYARCETLGLEVNQDYLWYHSIDLGDDLVTPGVFDYRHALSAYALPGDMHGLTVLDVGTATGFFAFTCEGRGADVTATELPSLDALDRFPGQGLDDVVRKAQLGLTAYNPRVEIPTDAADLYELLLHGPFDFCRRHLDAKVRRCFTTIYDLPHVELGRKQFDLVLIGDLLLHTIDPLRALAAAAAVCADRLVVAQYLPTEAGPSPSLLWQGGADPASDMSEWFWPNRPWLEQVLSKLGFRSVEVVGTFDCPFLPTGQHSMKSVVHARRSR